MVVATAPTNELRDKLQVKSPAEIVEYINALVYGEFGSGKTYLGGTADDDVRLKPLLVVDIEGGLTTIRARKDVDVVSIRTIVALENLYNDIYHSIEAGEIYYKTIMVDSGTELADLDMRNVMKQAQQRNPDKVDIDVPSPREYGIVRNHMRILVRAFRDLPCHTVWTASRGEKVEIEGMPPRYFPGFQGKLAAEIPGFFDIVGYLSTKVDGEGVTSRTLQTASTRRVAAKDRTQSLPKLLENPTLPLMWDFISGVKSVNSTQESNS